MVSLTLLSPSGESVPIPFPRPKAAKDHEDDVSMPPPKMNIVVPYSGKYDRTKDLEDVVHEPLIHDIDEFLKSKNVKGCTNIRPDIGLSDEELMVTTTKELNEIMRKMQISPARAKRIRYERRILRVVASNKSLENERHDLKSRVHDLSQSLNSSEKQMAELEARLQSLKDMEKQNDEEIMNLIRDEPGLIHEVKPMFCNCDRTVNYTCVYCSFEA
ncbi:hypothetical protein TCAL_13313 [Tigriopus californicus]|uniref:Uncharacterized protein n=1 Tax=Tigriopus californicus TaxID=6832 RepID=A0A553NXG9_TIGCA|nr:uncharacterized protein LOC131887408 [Tigriopus californicus]XP_059091991.1 uncharacterized protein LOC131887408 [Tigriopus californicus]TRY70107.1 hypothetical protein TCAL_13313 [Tigriopus californicus]|eukprot:TCALIF_13313-PA protein Name:"Protein of unknown function" AED:0.00 eAED:0.00 QI:286/1/1/1/0.66/0.5/4/25/215